MKVFCVLLAFIATAAKVQAADVEFTFNVAVDSHTPQDEIVSVYFHPWSWCCDEPRVVPLEQVTANQWTLSVDNECACAGAGGLPSTLFYKYCRNYIDFGADETFGPGNQMGMREVIVDRPDMVINDTVAGWRWWPIDGVVPSIDESSYEPEPLVGLPRGAFLTGISFPDFWAPHFRPLVPSMLDSIVSQTRAGWIQYNIILPIKSWDPPIVEIGRHTIPDEELIELISFAHGRGLKVFLSPLPYPVDIEVNPSMPRDEEWWAAFEDQWRPLLMHYGDLAEVHSVDMFEFRGWWNASHLVTAELEFVDNLARPLLADLRNVYSGPISVECHLHGEDMNVYGDGDFLSFYLWGVSPFVLSDSREPTVEEMLANLRTGLDDIYERSLSKWGKNAIVNSLGAASFDGFVAGEAYFEDHSYNEEDDPDFPVDLQEQADAYEAILHAIAERDWIVGAFSFNYNYWDSLDKAPSIRAKPAERVVSRWFGWMNPERRTLSLKASEGGTTEPGPGSYVTEVGDTVDVSAVPDDGFQFLRWIGDVPTGGGNQTPLTVTLAADVYLKALFIDINDVEIFGDDFESGDLLAWSSTVGGG